MQFIDYVLLAAVTVSIVIGVIRGFFREALSLVTWIVAVWVAWEYGHIAVPVLSGALAQPAVKLWVGRFLLFVVVLLVGSLIGWGLSMLVQRTGLSGADRVLGMGFGLGRGVLIAGLLVLLGQILEMEQEPWWRESRLVPYGARVADWIRDFLEDSVPGAEEAGALPAGGAPGSQTADTV